MRLLLVGASPELCALARTLGHDVVGVVDPSLRQGEWFGIPALDDDDEAVASCRPEAAVIAIDDPHRRDRVQSAFEARKVKIASLIGGYLGSDSEAGPGLVVQRLAHLSERCRIGRGVRINVAANVMHDSQLGDFVTIAPNAVVLGRVTIGRHSYVGANATILPGLEIGSNCTVGAGSVVTRDVLNGSVVKGNPAS